MRKSIKTVAIVCDLNGGCKYVALVKNVDTSEYADLLHEQRQHEQKEAKEKREILDRCETLEETIAKLEKEIKVLKGEDEDEQIEESIED